MYSMRILFTSIILILVMGASMLFGVYLCYDHFDKNDVSDGTQNNTSNNSEDKPTDNPDNKQEEPSENTISLGETGLEISVIYSESESKAVDKDTVVFANDVVWTAPHAEVVYLLLENKQDMTVSYSVGVKFADKASAKNSAGEDVKLSELLMFGIINQPEGIYEDSLSAIADVSVAKPVSNSFARVGAVEANDYVVLALTVYLPESAGEITGGEIDLGLSVFATSSFEGGEEIPENPNTFTESVETPAVDESGATTSPVTIGGGSKNSAVLPEGVKLNEGAESLLLTVQTIEAPNSDVPVNEGETARAIDVHIEGVAEDNTVPMIVTLNRLLPKGLNTTSVKIYHIENGTPVEMTLVENPVNHNEFSYNPTNGNVVMAVASFSEYVPVTDDKNNWKGSFDYSWYTGKTSPYTISSADQLAGFGKIVDGTAEGIAADSFAGKVVKLGTDIDLSGGVSLNPIGCGYVNGTTNSGKVTGYSFEGTFDGQGYTISNLNQNGWDLGLSYCNLGGGLFASVHNATIQNLTMQNANIIMECVEQGVIAGLAQGNCKFIDINIVNCSVANYQKATGGVVGEVSWGAADAAVCTHEFTNINIDSQTVVGSLWGDFDAPVGGVIGARWDDNNGTAVKMTNVTVACRLDVYNDVTSSYQWYAYRRAGMLIGNTENTAARDDGATVAAAPFLSCENVVVKYGDWTNYHYCEFNNHNSSWPFVRVEAGENCTAFSNPRWGVPNDINGVKVTPEHHPDKDTSIHQAGDTCYELIKFDQLYGGGQGVYGQTTHTGVTVQDCYYTITYREGDTIHHTEKITDNSQAITSDKFYKMPGLADDAYQWVNSGSTVVTSIPAGNINDVTLYLDRADTYIARFLYQDGTLYKAIQFNNQTGKLNEAEPTVPEEEGLKIVGWETYTLKGAKGDVSIKPVYKINDYVQLNPVDEDNDGVTDYYEVVGSDIPANNTDIIIPEIVNGIEVQYIVTGAFANGGLRDVYVPNSVKHIGKNSFCKDDRWEYPQIQIIFDGTRDEWEDIAKDSGWDDNIGTGSVIICERENPIGYYQQTGSNGFLGFGARVTWTWVEGTPDWYPRTQNAN